MTMKMLKEKKTSLTARKNTLYEDFCFARSKHREIQNVASNVRAMLDLKPKIELGEEEIQRQDSTETKDRN